MKKSEGKSDTGMGVIVSVGSREDRPLRSGVVNSNDCSITFFKENELVKIPSKRNEDAGYDTYVDKEAFMRQYPKGRAILPPGETIMVGTGLRSVIPTGWYAQFQERSSTGSKALKVGAGVVDSGYRGIWHIILTNCSNKTIVLGFDEGSDIWGDRVFYNLNKAVGQFIVHRVPVVDISEGENYEEHLYRSERGEGMLGSSGK